MRSTRFIDENGNSHYMKPTPDKSLIQIGEEFLIGCGLVAVAVLIVLIAI